jgi:plastocyanin
MRRLSLFAALTALVIAGCGGSSNSEKTTSSSSSNATSTPTPTATTQSSASSGGGGETLKLAADKSALKFDKSSLSAKAGKVTIVMANPSGIPHAVAVEGNGVDKDGKTVGNGGTSTVSVTLKPGKYQFYCPVDGHKAAGMKGTLTVQ